MRYNILQANVKNQNGHYFSLETLEHAAKSINETVGIPGADKFENFFVDLPNFDLRNARFVSKNALVENGILSVEITPIDPNWTKPENSRFRPAMMASLNTLNEQAADLLNLKKEVTIEAVKSINLVSLSDDANNHVPE